MSTKGCLVRSLAVGIQLPLAIRSSASSVSLQNSARVRKQLGLLG